MPQLVISGMHRSGTSLLANLLGKAGLPLGNRLRGPSEFNQKGHFEDDDFVEFHEDLLTANGTSIYLGSMPDPLRIDDSFQERAKALVSARADRSVWGWKDPRTALFLEFWDRILPDAHYLFIYRRLEEVVDSLRRRADLGLVPRWHGAWPLQQIGLCRFSPTRAIRMCSTTIKASFGSWRSTPAAPTWFILET